MTFTLAKVGATTAAIVTAIVHRIFVKKSFCK
jgi:hypothetical protein